MINNKIKVTMKSKLKILILFCKIAVFIINYVSVHIKTITTIIAVQCSLMKQ